MKKFAIGCYQFTYSDENNFDDFSPIQFKKDVVAALQDIENLSQLKTLNEDDEALGFHSFVSDADEDMYPCLPGFEVAFSIFIPRKAHPEIAPDFTIEQFYVHIYHGYDRPVVFVWFESDDSAPDNSPSDAIIIVREYLKSRIANNISFDIIGPSPFHANFFINEQQAEQITVIDKSKAGDGYGTYEISSPPLQSGVWGLSPIVSHLGNAFSQFYFLQMLVRTLRSHRRDMMNTAYELLEESPKGLFRSLFATLRNHKEVDTLQRSSLEESFTRLQIEDFIKEHERDGGLAAGTALAKHFQTFRDEIDNSDYSASMRVADFFEERRLRLMSNLNVVFAGLMGGVIGAIIGATATKVIDQSSANQPIPTKVEQTRKAQEPAVGATDFSSPQDGQRGVGSNQ